MSGIGILGGSALGFNSNLLLGYYQAQLAATPTSLTSAAPQNQGGNLTQQDLPPWYQAQPAKTALQAKLLQTTNFLDTSNVPLSPGSAKDARTEQDNQKLFSIYNAINSLSQLAQMAQDPKATSGQLTGLDSRFQAGLAQIQSYIDATNFNNFNLQSATPSASVTSNAKVAIADNTYKTQRFLSASNIDSPVAGLSTSDSFTISIKKGGTTTPVTIDLSQVAGPLTLKNIVTHINSQLSQAGFATRFQINQQGGTATSNKGATYGLQISPGGVETVSLSATSKPALYMVGNSGNPNETSTAIGSGSTVQSRITAADQSGRLIKIGNLDTTPTAIATTEQQASSGITTAQATVVDASGNIYVLGNATGDFGSQLGQGDQDVYLTKYDSAGNVAWQNLVGSAGTASGYSMALDPAGGVVIAGASTANMTTTSIGTGNNDSFVALYDNQGNQSWVKQIPTLAANQANAVSVDASGNIVIGGSVSGGVIGAGQVRQGGSSDAYLVTLNHKGKILSENQFGTTGADQVSATAFGNDGSLYVASTQNGQAIIAKYAGGDITSAPLWTQNLGALQAGGGVGGLTVSGNQIYVSGTTSNANLTAGGAASIAAASSGGMDAFVFNLTDNGSSATANRVSYVGTSAADKGGAVTVGPDGTVYLAGTTNGTFAGQTRSIANLNNAFVTAIKSDGSVAWTQQYGGASGQSTGAAVAVDPNGASVLDALGLPSGTINVKQSVALASQTTLRAGDSFKMKIEGVAERSFTITIDAGETFGSLVTKINAQLGATGKAEIVYTGHAQSLKITAKDGQTIDLISGPKDMDGLSRLGITAGVISGGGSASASSGTTPTYGLGLTGGLASITGGTLNIATRTGANMARTQMLTVLSNIQKTYQTTNAPPADPAKPGNYTGTASSQSAAQLASYGTALSLLGTSSSTAMSNIQMIVAGYSPNGG